jgi:hypothetical protein
VKEAFYLRHSKNFHGITISLPKRKTACNVPTLLPEVDTSELQHYCSPCKVHFSSICSQKRHMRGIHQTMIIAPPAIILHPHIIPDPNDRKFNCKACEKKYPSIDEYRYHLIVIRSMKLKPIPKPHLDPDPMIPTFIVEHVIEYLGQEDITGIT